MVQTLSAARTGLTEKVNFSSTQHLAPRAEPHKPVTSMIASVAQPQMRVSAAAPPPFTRAGQAEHATLHTTLSMLHSNEGTQIEARTFTLAATDFLVVRIVQHMYDILLSTHCI
jgi:hypothetical protein